MEDGLSDFFVSFFFLEYWFTLGSNPRTWIPRRRSRHKSNISEMTEGATGNRKRHLLVRIAVPNVAVVHHTHGIRASSLLLP